MRYRRPPLAAQCGLFTNTILIVFVVFLTAPCTSLPIFVPPSSFKPVPTFVPHPLADTTAVPGNVIGAVPVSAQNSPTVTSPQISPIPSSSLSATPTFFLSSPALPSPSPQSLPLLSQRNTSNSTDVSPAPSSQSPNSDHTENQGFFEHNRNLSYKDHLSHVSSVALTWSPLSKLAAVVRALFTGDVNATHAPSSSPSILSLFEIALKDEQKQSGLESADNEKAQRREGSRKSDVEGRRETAKPLDVKKPDERSVVIDQLRIRPFVSPYASYYTNPYEVHDNYGRDGIYGPHPHSYYQRPPQSDAYGMSSFLRMARNFATNGGTFGSQSGNDYGSSASYSDQSYGSANAELSATDPHSVRGVSEAMNVPFYEQNMYFSPRNSYAGHDVPVHSDVSGGPESSQRTSGEGGGGYAVSIGQAQMRSSHETLSSGGSASTNGYVEGEKSNVGTDSIRSTNNDGNRESYNDEVSTTSSHGVTPSEVDTAQNPAQNQAGGYSKSAGDTAVAQSRDSHQNSEDNAVKGIDGGSERMERFLQDDSQSSSGDGSDPVTEPGIHDVSREGTQTQFTPPSKLPSEPKDDSSENTGGNDGNENSDDRDYDSEKPVSITSRVEVTPSDQAFRGVPGGIKNGENITQLSLMAYKVARSEQVTSMAAVPCFEVREWMPSVVHRLESETIGFEFHCVDVMDNEEDVVENRARLQALKEAYGDISGQFIQTTADDVSLHLPMELDMVVSWMGLQKWGMRKGWRFLKGLRRTKAKRLLLSNDSVRNNIQGEQGLLNVRKSPMLFNEPSRVISKVTEDDSRQLLLYEMDKIRDKF